MEMKITMNTKHKIIAPSLLSANFLRLEEEIKKIEQSDAEWLHLDIMDGHFVPNITFGSFIVNQIRHTTNLILDTHLMIENPEIWIERYANAGSNIITVHKEATVHLHRTIQKIKSLHKKAGVSINPATHPFDIEYVLEDVYIVLVMSVNPGFGGQKFISNINKKIEYLNNLRIKNGYEFLIEVDGGINRNNILRLKNLGVDVFVAGSYIFNAHNNVESIKELKNMLK